MPERKYQFEPQHEIDTTVVKFHPPKPKTVSGSKFNASMERKLERLLCQSKSLGWSYSDFATHVLEVLIVLRQRDEVNLSVAGVKAPLKKALTK